MGGTIDPRIVSVAMFHSGKTHPSYYITVLSLADIIVISSFLFFPPPLFLFPHSERPAYKHNWTVTFV